MGLGVGKFMLLLMLVKGVLVDVVVIGLIGECGCELCEFVEEILGDEGFVCVVVIVVILD